MPYDDDRATMEQRIVTALQTGRIRVYRSDWMSRTGPSYWLGYLRHDWHEAAYTIPRRIACRVLRRHNPTCVGRPAPHPRRW